jgi:DNA (cytosine-5)-methyltransferase 1
MTKLRVLDLFSGIGGFSLGLERTGGFETVAFCEIEAFPRKVLAKHWPEVACYDDVRTLTAERLAADGIAVDVICGGFPCQDVSTLAYVHGRSGLDGERSGLFFQIIRLIDELAPQAIILENVPGLLVGGAVAVLQAFFAVGYDAEWHSIPAAALGSAQARDRVWFIAYPSQERNAGPFQGLNFSQARQGWQGRQAHLQHVAASPFAATDSFPQPLLCGVDVRVPNWVDRIGACGNSAHPGVTELIGNAILESMAA